MTNEENSSTKPEKTTEKNETVGKAEKNNKNGQKQPFFQAAIKKIGLGLLFFLIGALVVVLSLYLPSASSLKKAQTEVDRLMPIETEFYALQEEFQTVSTEAGVYKILSNSSLLQIALIENNSSRINQYLRYVEDGIENLDIPEYPELPAAFSSQFTKVKSHAQTDQEKALDELEEFNKDLLLLIDNLE